ncbi:hypothetical protein [Legionella quinlivanii]|uniref:hypothetical protein n=1 Tax=Legionella quinlivanii TaxID=45073 RepID=UPI0022445DF1|nr:hypothetical protein [Legionella quinlivanii]MCW8450860.1 hypothetical protein [Legionella quinlivanii]
MLDGKNRFKLPETIKELVERVNRPSSRLEFRILSFIASDMLDIFNSTSSMDAARVQDLIELMDITDLFFRKRLIEVLLKAITSQLLIHNELWAGINAIKQKYGHHPEIGAVLSAQFENIFNKMFSFADNSFSPNSIIKILQECHLYLQLSIEANSQLSFLTPIEETKFYPVLKNLKEHPDIDLRYHATIILQALFYLQCNKSPSENLSSSHAKMTAQFNFGNRTFTRNRETVLTLNEEAKKNVAASFASAGFNEHFVETQLPQVNLRINKDKKEKYHHKYNEQFFYETCHFMDILMPQIQEFFSSDFLSRPPQTIKHTQSLFEQHYLLHLALSKIEENNNYLSLVTHICRSNAFDPGVRCKAMFALFQSKHPFSTECLSLTAQYFSDKNTLKCQKNS